MNINVAWDAATDITNATADGTEPGLRSNSTPRRSGYTLQMNLQQILPAAQAAGQASDGSYTIPFFTAMPVATTNLMVQMDGHPKALPPGKSNWATESVNAAAGMTVFYTGTPRPRLVTQEKCENCHNQLSLPRRESQWRSAGMHRVPQQQRRLHRLRLGPDRFRRLRAQHPHRRGAGGSARSRTRRASRVARLATSTARTTRRDRVRWRSARDRVRTSST